LLPLAIERGHRYFSSSIVSYRSLEHTVRSAWPRSRVRVVYRSERDFYGIVELEP
jgi:hypothetical protein